MRTPQRRTIITAGAILAVALLLALVAYLSNFRGFGSYVDSLTARGAAPQAAAAPTPTTQPVAAQYTAETSDNQTVLKIDEKEFIPVSSVKLTEGATYNVVLLDGNYYVIDSAGGKLKLSSVLVKTLNPEPTLTPSPTSAMTQTVVVDSPLTNPALFDGQSTGKEYMAHYDIGVNTAPRQIGIVFGRYAEWNGQTSGSLDKGCALVVLYQGWNGNLGIQDGRYEIYNLPAFGDYNQWGVKLANERAAEQAAHYGCPAKDITKGQIPVWDSTMPSPPNPFLANPTGSISNTVATGNMSGTIVTVIGQSVNACMAAYNDNIGSWKTKDLSTEDKVLAALKAAGVTYDQIDFVRVADGNVQIASATNLHVPYPMGLATDATADQLVQGAFKSVDLTGGNSLNSDVTLKGKFGGVIWFDVRNWKQFCGPEAQVSNQAAAPAQAAASSDPILTGKGQSKEFAAGSSVVAYKIELKDGTVLTPNGCYAKDLKQGGTATDGVINPVAAQYANAPACTNVP